jgi:ABC-type taurine transport system substrate-binding protein
MSDADTSKLDVSKIPLDPVVKAAEQSIAAMYSVIIEAMNKDAAALLTKNGASNPPPDDSVKTLTADMISLLGTRLLATLQKADTDVGKKEKP